MTEPVASGQVNSQQGADAQILSQQPEPLGIVPTFGWAILASIAAALAGTAFMLALPTSPWALLIDTDAASFACIGATIAEIAFFGVIVRACRQRGWRPTDYLGLVRPQGGYLRASLIAFVLATAASFVVGRFGPLIEDRDSILGLLSPGYFVFVVVIAAPIVEELIFRGFLYRGLAASRLGISGAILVTSFLWTSLHTERTWLGLAELFFCGVVYGWLRWRSDSTITPIAVHGVNNVMATVMYFAFPVTGAST
jgi:membrane protease YdiL (CAAX protease family)